MSTHALIATARFHGEVAQHRFPPGKFVRLGGEGALALPLPANVPWLAQIEWDDARRARVTDPTGRQFNLVPDETLELHMEGLVVELELSPTFSLKRTERFPWKLSVGWLVVVLLFTIFTSWYDLVKQRVCPIFAVTPELAVRLQCVEQQANNSGGPGSDFTAEYLARLLKEDYAGEEDGVLERAERPDAEREQNDIFLPAGNRGPIEEMGGAEETAVESIRAPRSEREPEPERKKPRAETTPLSAPDDVGTPIEAQTDASADQGEHDEDTEAGDEEDVDEASQPAEEEEGWGLQDWYDESDAKQDKLEIDYTIHVAKRRLRIDPNDPAALSLLSYYQYLDEDYDAAEATYDKYIQLLPDEAAGYNNKALIYKRRGQYQKEEALYRVALSLEPLDVTALNNLGVNLAHQGRHAEALAVMEQLEALDPGDPYADLHRAKIHAEMGNDEAAYTYLEQSLKGMAELDTLHHIEFRQDIRLDPSFAKLRETRRFRAILLQYYGDDTPLQE